ncbi:hypothetical protein D3C71_1596960 [compost metagenome]
MANTTPALGLLVKPLIESPVKARVPSTFSLLAMIAPIRSITLSVRSRVAPSGSWAKPIRYCLSWEGTKPPGTLWNRP